MKIVFLGAPGAGKGTQADVVSREYNIPIIATGQIIREAVSKGTPIGLAAKNNMSAGKLLDDDIVITIVKEKLNTIKGGYILDGFPRTIRQAEALEEMGQSPDIVINIFVPDDVIVKRSVGRRFCPSCGSTYHIMYKPPSADKDGNYFCTNGVCVNAVIMRDDDKEEVIKSRLVIYHEQTKPLEEFYKSRGKLKTVVGQEEVADTSYLTLETIKKAIEL